MISKDEKQRLRGIISETITLLCKSRLFEKFKEEFYIEGLIGITLDQEELMIVSIHEKICNDIKEDTTTPVKKDHPVVEDAGNHRCVIYSFYFLFLYNAHSYAKKNEVKEHYKHQQQLTRPVDLRRP